MPNLSPLPRWLRPGFRFGLASLLAGMALIGVPLGRAANRAAAQRSLVAEVESLGGFVRYDHDLVGSSVPLASPSWLTTRLGRDWTSSVVHVYLSGPQVTDAIVPRLAGTRTLELVVLEGTAVTPSAGHELRQALPDCVISGTSVGRR